MQLIVGPESALDLEINMSDKNVQNNKNDDLKNVNLDIDDLGSKKCNGNELPSELKENSKSDGENGFIREIVEKIVDMPMSINNTEAEMSNVDLSDIINENNDSLEVENLPTEQSQKQNLEKRINGSLSVENGTINIDDCKESIEDDYLEDDIISIVAEPCKEVSLPDTEVENVDLEKSDIISDNSIADEEDKQEVDNNAEENLHIDKTTSIDTDDVVELIEDTDENPVQSIKDTNLPIPKENIDVDHIAEKQGIIQQDKTNVKQVTSQNEDDLSIVEETEKSADRVTPVPTPLEGLENIEVIDKPDSDCRHEKKTISNSLETTVHDIEAEVTKVEKKPVTYDTSKELTTDMLKQDEVEIIEEIEKTVPLTEDGNNEINIIEETEKDLMQSNENKDSEMREATDEIGQITITLDSPANKTHDVEIIDDSDEPCERYQNNTDVQTGEVKGNDNMQDINIETTSKTLNSETELQESIASPVDDPNVLTESNMDVEEIAKAAAIAADSQFVMDVEDEIENNKSNDHNVPSSTPVASVVIDKPVICKLSNTLDILSDDEELPEINFDKPPSPKDNANNKPIDLEDDDVMVIDEYTKNTETETPAENNTKQEEKVPLNVNTDSETGEKTTQETSDVVESQSKKEITPPPVDVKDLKNDIDIKEKKPEPIVEHSQPPPPPLIPDNFVNTAKKKLADMTRDDLEEFCILKIVESIIDRSSLSDIKNKLKAMAQGLEEYRKKSLTLTKQNRDLQVVLKSVQEEQKKATHLAPITPLKITRSVGMQVYMEKTPPRKKGPQQNINNKTPNNAPNKTMPPLNQTVRVQKQVTQSIPVPRLVPANSPASKATGTMPQVSQMNTPPNKSINPTNGMIKTPPTAVKAEKRQHNKISSVTVDLTDDEPPTKIPGAVRTSPGPPVRLVSPQNLMAPQRPPFGANVNSPRKVYIPISGPQNQALRPGQTIMLKPVPTPGIRPRCPTPQVTRVDPNSVRMGRIPARHPAPLPVAMKQYQPPNWKSLPPAPDLKLSKVENGIVISWKIEGVPEDSYEEIASYQLYAYQETSQPPSTSLWKKIGDVKALPLPMACTLTQFMAGFKYYFAVRAVDIRSRLGAFSLPGSILLLSKNI